MLCTARKLSSFLIILLLSLPFSHAQSCQGEPGNDFSFIDINPRPSANDPLTGGDTLGARCDPLSNQPNVFQCLARSPFPLLIDGDLGPEGTNYANTMVHAWHRSAGTVSIMYTLDISTEIRHMNLYFYSITSMGIGLPSVTVYRGSTAQVVEYHVFGNDDITQEDNMRRQILLSLRSTSSSRSYTLQFDFENTDVDWLVLSETRLCTVPLQAMVPTVPPSLLPNTAPARLLAANLSPNLTLSCTVAGEGRFSWQWTDPDGNPPSAVILSNVTRTSIAFFTNIRGTASGSNTEVHTYACHATYSSMVNGIENTATQSIGISPEGILARHMTPERVLARVGEEAILSCEVYGYFSEVPNITWRTSNQEPINTDHPYFPFVNISTSEGDRFIQDGGSDFVPSRISTMRLSINDSDFFRVFLCDIGPEEEFFQINEADPVAPTVDMSTPSDPTNPSEPGFFSNTTNIIIIAVAGTLLVIILLVIIVIVVLVVLRNKSRSKDFRLHATNRKDSLDYTGEEYEELGKPAPPPLPEQFPALNHEIEAYAMVSSLAVQQPNGDIEMMDRNQSWVPLMTATDIDPSTIRHSDQLPFLEKNPLYASSDNMNDSKHKNNQHHRRIGSIPSLDVLTDSPTGSQLNIYADPTQVAPPVPLRPPTPELIGADSIYSEASIHPNLFHARQRMFSNAGSESDDILPCTSVYANPLPLLRSEGPKEVTSENIRELKALGMGQFGQVVLADTVNLSCRDLGLSLDNRKDVTIQVAVKRLKSSAEPHVKEAFEKEIKFMSRLHNENVVRLLGICPTNNPFIIMEYMEKGDLNQFLRKHKFLSAAAAEEAHSTPSRKGLTARQLTHICAQIASGMKYLASFKFIHRDLATRNCLVGSDLRIKIADFGMSRSLYTSYYYRISGRAMLPIRWMANECFFGKFSEKTDVWAFGVTMWEVFTFSKEQPYESMTDQEVIDDAIKGPDRMLLPRPEYCPEVVYEVMKACWIDEPEDRARFLDAQRMLENICNCRDL